MFMLFLLVLHLFSFPFLPHADTFRARACYSFARVGVMFMFKFFQFFYSYSHSAYLGISMA